MSSKAMAAQPGGGGGGGVAAVDEDLGGDGMQCSDHPYRNNTPAGGICALCLQEKLGKLVSSSSSSFFIASSCSSSPSFRSDPTATRSTTTTTTIASAAASLSLRPSATAVSSDRGGAAYQDRYHCRRARMPFLLAQKKKKKVVASSVDQSVNVALKRSKSTATPGRASYLFSDGSDLSPHRRGFWSFFHHLSKNASKSSPKSTTVASSSSLSLSANAGGPDSAAAVGVDETAKDESPANSTSSNAASFGRKVSRSRSVGCGSRSFSGDFFERISTGFGDCTLRRVESHREGKRTEAAARGGGGAAGGDTIKERVRCSGIFGGFMMTSSSSSSSSSSYWVSGSTEENGRGAATTVAGTLLHGRNWSWGWAFASPRRAFSKPPPSSSSSSSLKNGKSGKNVNPGAPNLVAIPSLLAVGG